jgi:hypothetical protein
MSKNKEEEDAIRSPNFIRRKSYLLTMNYTNKGE